MKKLFTMALVALFALAANAQIVSSRSESIQRAPKNHTSQWYLRAGVGSVGISGKEFKESKSTFGYEVELGYQRFFNGADGAHLGFEFGIQNRGCKFEVVDSYNYHNDTYTTKDNTFSTLQLNVQPIFGWKIPVGAGFSVDPHVGVFFGYDLTGSMSENDDFDFGDYKDAGWNAFDAGMSFGVGAWYKNFNFDLKYKYSFTSAWEPDDEDGCGNTNGFMVTVAYAF